MASKCKLVLLGLLLFCAPGAAKEWIVQAPHLPQHRIASATLAAVVTIQDVIDATSDGDIVFLSPGTYRQSVNLRGKAITLVGLGGAAILEGSGMGIGVHIEKTGNKDCLVRNVVVSRWDIGITVEDGVPVLDNVTVVNNNIGMRAESEADPTVVNCIFALNRDRDLVGCQASFCWIQSEKRQGLDSGLQHAWSFDDQRGNVAFDRISGYHGKYHNTWIDFGAVGQAAYLDGVSSYVELPDHASNWLPDGDFTLSLWIWPERAPGASLETFLDLNYASSGDPSNELGCALQRKPDTGEFVFGITTFTNSDECLFVPGLMQETETWYHVVGVRKGHLQALFVNGMEVGSRWCSAADVDYSGGYDDNRVSIGRSTTAGTSPRYFFKGLIDEVLIYRRGLSGEEIGQLYTRGLAQQGVEPGPLFADPQRNDYRLISERGRYWPKEGIWVADGAQSPCIDAGHPDAPVLFEAPPHGGRINMGAYGGTPQASLGSGPVDADLNHDGVLDDEDLDIWIEQWFDAAEP